MIILSSAAGYVEIDVALDSVLVSVPPEKTNTKYPPFDGLKIVYTQFVRNSELDAWLDETLQAKTNCASLAGRCTGVCRLPVSIVVHEGGERLRGLAKLVINVPNGFSLELHNALN
ncbi:MAG: hypothetical protein HRU20_28175 [Pseudomonadales bacterium]|nr:hypothetical protein [Pseudomonadales bacterium]